MLKDAGNNMASAESADLLLIAHGTSRARTQADALERHAEALRRLGGFRRVASAYLQGSAATPEAVLATLDAVRVFILPHFMSAGYFAARKIPARLGLAPLPEVALTPENRVPGPRAIFARHHGSRRQTLCYCPPSGSHPGLGKIARRLALRAASTAGIRPAQSALIVLGHGTARDDASKLATEKQAAQLDAHGDFALVRAAFLEQTPSPERVLDDFAPAWSDIVLLPLLAGHGRHGTVDLPVLAERARTRGQRLHLAAPVGDDPEMADLMLDLVKQARAGLDQNPNNPRP